MPNYRSLECIVAAAAANIGSAEELTVSEAAQQYVFIRQPGAHVGPWSADKTPYLLEPQDQLTSLDVDGMIFVGPARTGKSQVLQNWVGHTAKCDPTDMMVVHMTQSTGREWSKSDLEKLFRNSPKLKGLLKPGRQNDNTFDKEFLSGMRLTVTWPTANNLSGKTIRYNWLMDYDRMPDSIDGEGNAYDLTKKRATTFKRFGMTVAESSPNPDKEIKNPKWRPPHAYSHEGPPISGIFELYNRGDRRRWHWRCPHCEEPFEPTFKCLSWPESDDLMESAEQVTMTCPSNGCVIEPALKDQLNMGGRWVREGMMWMPDGSMEPRPGMKPLRSNIASFWLQGPAAAFQTWQSLVLEYLRAEAAFAATGDEEPLKKTVTTDQGSFYIPKARQSERLPEDLKDRVEDWGSTREQPTVPHDVRFLIAAVDVQARGFVVQVNGFTPSGDMVIIDGFKISKSNRRDEDGDKLHVDPAAYAEDWDLLIDQVILKQYLLEDGSGTMAIRLTGCDSGGAQGVTHQAYNFYRRLREDDRRLHRRFMLVKGDGKPTAPRTVVTHPDSNQTGFKAVAKGDVPILRINSLLVKDQVAAMLSRRVAEEEQGGGMIRYPSWMPDWFYGQMTTELRTVKGWINPGSKRNEAWDLSYYGLAAAIRPHDPTVPWATFTIHRIDWENPPIWADVWAKNSMVTLFHVEPEKEEVLTTTNRFAELGAALA